MAPVRSYTNWNSRTTDEEEQIEPYRKYFFICEGANTETWYFKKLIDIRKELNIHPLIDIRLLEKTEGDRDISFPRRLIEFAENQKENPEIAFGSTEDTVLPDEIIEAVEDCGFFESIPLWAVTLIGGLFITVLSFIMIMSVYGRFFRLYLYTAIAPIPLSSFAGEPSQNIGRSFLKSYAAVCLEGAIVVLACIIFSLFASSPPVVDPNVAAVTMVWSYIGELIFNMLVLVGAVKMSDRVVREMMGL